MSHLTIGWEYLTGYAVATDPASRDRAEWPPHPGRVFMALAAAWFETEPAEDDDTRPAWEEEGQSLRWLEQLAHPELHMPPHDPAYERSNVTVYVPVNDRAGPSTATLQSAPAITRSRQPRTFPRTHVGSRKCFLHWPQAEGVETHRTALQRLCERVTRVGHSSSLVRMGLADVTELEFAEPATGELTERLIPEEVMADMHLRTVSPGTLDMLVERYGEAPRQRHRALTERRDELKSKKKAVKGKGAKERKAEIDADIEQVEQELSGIEPRPVLRPEVGLFSGYRRGAAPRQERITSDGNFDHEVLILSHVGGPRLPLVSTLQVMKSLRGAIMSRGNLQQDTLSLVSGHESSGAPLTREQGHLACIPLPAIGHAHADGHLLGAGLVFPSQVPHEQRGEALRGLLVNEYGEPQSVILRLGRLGEWIVRKRDWSEQRRALQPETWTAHPTGAATWASVTPVVLDRFPKTNPRRDRSAWTREVAQIVIAACRRIGLPEPELVDIDQTSWHLGSPPAVGRRRRLRGSEGTEATRHATRSGDGFPPWPPRGTNASRPQVHVRLRFPRPVIGPVLLGAGRYRGYGLCSPVKETDQ